MTEDQKKYLKILLFKWMNLIPKASIENIKDINIDVIKHTGVNEEVQKNIKTLKPAKSILLIKKEIEKFIPEAKNINPIYQNEYIQPEHFQELFVEHNVICIKKIMNLMED